MGRGRAKAKQTKVARELKYSSPSTDLDALQRELAGGGSVSRVDTGHSDTALDDDEDYVDPYADEDDDDSWASQRR